MPAIDDLPARIQALIDQRRRYEEAAFAIGQVLAAITAALDLPAPKGGGRPLGVPSATSALAATSKQRRSGGSYGTAGDEPVLGSHTHAQGVPGPRSELPIPSPLGRLSPRQRQTLVGLISGSTELQIAKQLGVTRNTIHVYIKAVYRKHGVSSRAELLSRYISPREFFQNCV